jgi:hypothetical protein
VYAKSRGHDATVGRRWRTHPRSRNRTYAQPDVVVEEIGAAYSRIGKVVLLVGLLKGVVRG